MLIPFRNRGEAEGEGISLLSRNALGIASPRVYDSE
jgi:hypothetical protein